MFREFGFKTKHLIKTSKIDTPHLHHPHMLNCRFPQKPLVTAHLRIIEHITVNYLLDRQFSSVAHSCLTLCNPVDCSSPGFPVLHISRSLVKLMSTKSMMPSNHLILCSPLLLLPSTFPGIRVFSNELSLCIRWSMDWSFNFSISSSNKYSGLISFRVDWFDLLAGQGTLKSLLQHHSLKASILWCSAFFMRSHG